MQIDLGPAFEQMSRDADMRVQLALWQHHEVMLQYFLTFIAVCALIFVIHRLVFFHIDHSPTMNTDDRCDRMRVAGGVEYRCTLDYDHADEHMYGINHGSRLLP